MNKTELCDAIDHLLPQTQCRLCGYAGCKPYAQAIANNEAPIDQCLPGGSDVLTKIAALTHTDATPLMQSMPQKTKPPSVAVIREDECIGCTKCLAACPVDAIIGASQHMHTVMTDVCTGCELCLTPCPVDCIDIKVIPLRDEKTQQAFQQQSRERYAIHQYRQQQKTRARREQYELHKFSELKSESLAARKAEIAAAVKRQKNKKQ